MALRTDSALDDSAAGQDRIYARSCHEPPGSIRRPVTELHHPWVPRVPAAAPHPISVWQPDAPAAGDGRPPVNGGDAISATSMPQPHDGSRSAAIPQPSCELPAARDKDSRPSEREAAD